MGLCKCSARKVSNLFCFEHHETVCDNCVVSEKHSHCVIKSYLHWLQDSDYEPICTLCNKLLTDEPCVRLLCLDIYHWSCFSEACASLPAHTAPAGYKCPACAECIFPSPQQLGPRVDALRRRLLAEGWAQRALGIATSASLQQPGDDSANSLHEHPPSTPTDIVLANSTSRPDTPHSHTVNMHDDDPVDVRQSERHLRNTLNSLPPTTSRSGYQPDEDKYSAKPIGKILSNWLSLVSPQKRGRSNRWLTLLVLGAIALFTLIYILSAVGRNHTSSDPILNPLANPNIRVEPVDME